MAPERNEPENHEDPRHFGEFLEHHVIDPLRLGYEAIQKHPDFEKKYAKRLATGAAMLGIGVAVGFEALQIYKKLHNIHDNDQAIQGLQPEHFDMAEEHMKNARSIARQNGNRPANLKRDHLH